MSCIHREQVELCVDILERILMALSPVHLAQNYRAELQGGLTHPKEIVKTLALAQVGKSHSCTLSHRKLPKNINRIMYSLFFSLRSVEWWSTPKLSPKSSTTRIFYEE